MTLNGVMAVTLRYFIEFGKPALQKTICGGIYARVYCILVRVQCRRKKSSHSLSHLLVSFLLFQRDSRVSFSRDCVSDTVKRRTESPGLYDGYCLHFTGPVCNLNVD